MIVFLPSPLYSYTEGANRFEVRGKTVREGLAALDKRFPGILFRMVDEAGALRRHMRIYVDGASDDNLEREVGPASEVHVIAALSGG
ncbi:MAG: MoaD/ThiS family protein [Planctomycetota bacterium]